MLCGNEYHDDAIALANCLLDSWDHSYSVYVYVYYALGIASVVMPIVATIMSDAESKYSRRAVTGLAAACVSLYAFLSPMDKIATYKSAHSELRESLMIYERLLAGAAQEQEGPLLRTFIDTIDAIEDRVLKSEMTNDGDSANMTGDRGQAATLVAGQVDAAVLKERMKRSLAGEGPVADTPAAPPPSQAR